MTTLYDAVTPANIPTHATMVAGYIDGDYQSYWPLASLFPSAVRISIAISGAHIADVLDVETGDANPEDAPGWVESMRSLGMDPTVYVSRLGTWPATRAAIDDANVPEPNWWVADQTGAAHLVPGSVATQWVNAGPYDISATNGTWHQATPKPPTPKPAQFPKEGPRMFATDPVTGGVWATDETGALYALDGAPYIVGANLNTHPTLGAGNILNPCVGIAYWKKGAVDGIAYYTRPTNGKGGIAGTPYSQYKWTRAGQAA